MKKIISLFLTVTMIASLIVAIPVTNVAAAETITDEALFMTYPTYLSNSEMDEGLAKAETAYYAVINSYTDSDETVAALMTSMSEGISILVKQGLANLGIGETLYETQAREAATKYMQSMLTNENVIKKASGMVDKAYKTLKTSYSIASNVDKTTMMADLVKVATENDISIKPDDIDDLVNDLYDSGSLKTDLAAIGEANKLWKIVFEFTEIHAIEKTTLDLLMDELSKSGQTGSDLYLGLSLLKKDMEKDSASYVLKYYATDKAVTYLADKADDLIGAVTSANAVSLVTTFMKVFADYIYVNAKEEDLTQAIMQTSFVSSIDICLSQYRLKFLQGTGTTEDIKTYENLYGAYLAAHKATLDTCYDIAKITDKFSLGGDCMIWSSNIETLYTYDKYIEWCKKEISHDISNNELDKTTGSSNITDALNEETIADRIERVLRLYPAGSKWAGDFGGTKSSLGYAGKVFNHIFDKTMSGKVENDYQYILTSNRNVRLIGRLEEKAVAEAALKELFTNVRIGDVVITSGQYDYLHAMTVVGMGETGPIVYDVDSKYGPAEEYTHLIQKYEFPYSKMADAFSSNGKYLTKPGISVYRAIKKVNTTNSGTSLYYEEYDDSVNYVIEDGILTGYKGSRTTIEIPDGVTSIAADCFKNNPNIKYVYMPDTITKIGDSAFYGCTNLRYVDLSSGLTQINDSLFYGCSSLGNVIIPNDVLIIEANAFKNCSSLNNVVLPSNIREIQNYAFNYCKSLTSIIIPSTLKTAATNDYASIFTGCTSLSDAVVEEGMDTIPDYLFKECVNLKNVTLPQSTTTIGKYAFGNCTNLGRITIPDSVTVIGESSFRGCSSLNNIILPPTLREIQNYGFNNCKALTSITIPKTLKKSANNDYASIFAGCTSLTDAVVEDGMDTIPNYLFKDCVSLKNVALPDSVTIISNQAFKNCSSLNGIILPNSLREIQDYAFNNCVSLNNITIPKSLKIAASHDYSSVFAGCTSLTDVIIQDGMDTIPDYLFKECVNLRNVTIPNSVTTIGEYVFGNCRNLRQITIPDSVTTIGIKAFKDCYTLDNLKLPTHLKEIKNYAFDNCKSLTSITIPATLKTAADYDYASVFAGCISLMEAIVEDGMITIPRYLFKDCINLRKVTLPDSVTTISNQAFKNCSSLSNIVLPSKLKEIQNYAFNNCVSLNNIIIPKSLEIAAEYDYASVFAGCISMTDVTIEDGMATIPNYLFKDCINLRNIQIPDSVQTIGAYAFANCTMLKGIIIPASVKSVKSSSNRGPFYGCNSLKYVELASGMTEVPDYLLSGCSPVEVVVIPDSVASIGKYSFADCKVLQNITLPKDLSKIKSYAFNNNKMLKMLSIPESVTTIENNAFNSCEQVVLKCSNDIVANYAKEKNISYIENDVLYAKTSSTVQTPSSGTLYSEYGVYFDAASNTITGYDGVSSSIIIPDYIDDEAVLNIAANAFKNATNLQEITIPNTVTTIGNFAFSNCINLSSVKLSTKLTSLGYQAFVDCLSLESIVLPAELSESGWYRSGSDYYYGNWFDGCYKLTEITIEDGSYSIPNYAFSNTPNLKIINLPSTVKTIGASAFANCVGLEKICLPNNTESLGSFIFEGCINLTDVELPDDLTTLGYGAFKKCLSLESIVLPAELSESGWYKTGADYYYGNWFTNCWSLKKITIETGALNIPAYAFQDTLCVEEVVLPNSIKTIGSFAFEGCINLEKITLPDNLTQLGYAAFGDCLSLESIVLPAELSESGWYRTGPDYYYGNWFTNCWSLKKITVETGALNIPAHAFQNTPCIEEIILPNTIKTIGNFAFEGCLNLKSITLPDNLTRLGYAVFENCSSLSNMVLPSDLSETGTYRSGSTYYYGNWFNGCYDLQTVVLNPGISKILNSAFENARFKQVYIPKSVTSIDINAFSNNLNLEKIFYAGTSAQWNDISIADNNASLLSAEIIYNLSSVSVSVTGISIDKASVNMNVGNEYAINYSVTPIDATNKNVSWTSSNSSVAEIKNGIVYAKAVGNATITAKTNDGNYTADFVVNVYDGNAYVIEADSLELDKQKVNIVVGGFDMVSAKINPINTTYRSLKWSSSNEDVVVVEDGVIFAKAAGKATITAETSCGATASCEVNVSEDSSSVAVTGITLNKSVLLIEEGKSETLIANITPSDATNKAIIWTSSDNNVATVSGGKITAVASGTATITAKTVNGGYTASCVVTVVPKVEITNFSVNVMGAYGLINLSTVNVPATADTYLAAYDCNDRLLELQTLTLSNGLAQTIMPVENIYKLKVFIWKKDLLKPLAEDVEYILGKTEITSFSVSETGKVNILATHIPDSATIYVASYNDVGKVLEVQSVALNNGVASAIFSTSSVYKYKAFIWKGDTIIPLSDPKECKLQ